MKVAKEHVYEQVNDAGLMRLAIPAGSPVSDEEMKLYGLRKSDVEEVKGEPGSEEG